MTTDTDTAPDAIISIADVPLMMIDVLETIARMSESQCHVLNAAINLRVKSLHHAANAANAVELAPGTKVRVSGSIRPKYLAGATGVVVGGFVKAGHVTVELDHRVGKFSGRIVFPAGSLSAV